MRPLPRRLAPRSAGVNFHQQPLDGGAARVVRPASVGAGDGWGPEPGGGSAGAPASVHREGGAGDVGAHPLPLGLGGQRPEPGLGQDGHLLGGVGVGSGVGHRDADLRSSVAGRIVRAHEDRVAEVERGRVRNGHIVVRAVEPSRSVETGRTATPFFGRCASNQRR